MLRSIAEFKLPSNLIILIDGEKIDGSDLFRAFLVNSTPSSEDVHLFCLENPSDFYEPCRILNQNLVFHNYCSDPCGWDDSPLPDLKTSLLNFKNQPGKTLYIDSLHDLFIRLGIYSVYKLLHDLKSHQKNVICLAHDDLIRDDQLEPLTYLATTVIRLKTLPEDPKQKQAEITHKKPGGKVATQTEIYSVSPQFKLSTRLLPPTTKPSNSSTPAKSQLNNLTTFELGLDMREGERKARDQLVLPYLRKEETEGGGIIYNLENIDLEEDPDDDLDI